MITVEALVAGKRYALAIEVDGKREAFDGVYDAKGDCFWIQGHAHSLRGRGDRRYMRENSISFSIGSVSAAFAKRQ